MPGGWNYNLNFWTGGTQQGGQGQWSWCGKNSPADPLSNDLKWESGQPDNKGGNENCLHMRFILNGTDAVLMSDRNCTEKSIYGCEVNQNYEKYDFKSCKFLLLLGCSGYCSRANLCSTKMP
jgi:hypothetical protein